MNLLVDPYEYQKKGIQFAFHKRYSLNGDRMGLGKTLQAIGVAALADVDKTLVICPAFLKNNWKSEIHKFTGETSKFDIVSYGSLSSIKTLKGYDLVVCDEVHYVKNLLAIRTQKLHSLMEKCPPKYFIGLSGTPIKNRVPEFYSLLRLVWLGGGYPDFDRYSKSPWLFNREFCNQQTLKIKGRKITKWDGLKNPEGLKALIKPIYIRRRAEEVLDLPDQVHSELLMADKDKTDELLKTAWESYEGKKASKSFSSGKAISALAKVKYTLEQVDSLLQADESVIVFTDHVQAAKKIAAGLDPDKVRCVTGETPTGDRTLAVELLNSGRIKAVVATIGALSVGVNITGVSNMIFNDFAWVPADMDQARARIHRIGQKNTCNYYYILASKVDQKVLQTIRSKENILQGVDV